MTMVVTSWQRRNGGMAYQRINHGVATSNGESSNGVIKRHRGNERSWKKKKNVISMKAWRQMAANENVMAKHQSQQRK